MSSQCQPILPLPVTDQQQLTSSVAMTSLNDVIIGLTKNSFDAQARTIKIQLDFSRGSCCVRDDGAGIHSTEFEDGGGLGLMHRSTALPDGPTFAEQRC